PSTKIKFTIPNVETTRRVVFTTMKVFDILGNEVVTLVNEEKPAGSYVVEFDGNNIPTGIYFYELHVGQFKVTKKMLLIK
ncbi:MAG: T9SS type A sorting domain-containing protein, partial [Ignavibacteriales bacterium]